MPKVLDDVLAVQKEETIRNSVVSELKEISPQLLKSLYLLSFANYEGFFELTM